MVVVSLAGAVNAEPLSSIENEVDGEPAHVTNVSLQTLGENDVQILLGMDGPVSHEVFVWAQPDRIVVDLRNAVDESFINDKGLSSSLVRLVRSGIHGGDRLRVVLDLNGPAYADSIFSGPDSNGHYQLLIGVHPIPLTKNQPVVVKVEPSTDNIPGYDSRLIQLRLDYPKAPDGSIEALVHSSGYMLPLSQLFQLLGFPIKVSAGEALADGWFVRANQNFVLDASKGEAIVGGKEYYIPVDLIDVRGNEIFVDTTLLERFFPVRLSVNVSLLTLTIRPVESLSGVERDQLQSQLLLRSDVAVPLPPQAMGEGVVVGVGGLSDDNLIVLQPMLDDEVYDDFVEVYQVGARYLVPLNALFTILRFPIVVDPDKGRAEGWYISEDRKFFLNVAEKRVQLKAGDRSILREQMIVSGADIFIDSELLSQWLPIGVEIDLQQLILDIKPDEMLPFQLREERLKKWKRIQQARKEKAVYPLIEAPYSLASMPFIDLNLAQTIRDSGDVKSLSAVSLLAAGDLAYMSSNLYVSGSSDGGGVDTLRFTSGRQSDRANLFGPLKATQFSVGDINSLSIPLVARSSPGRGILVSNRPVNQSSEFAATDFIGDAVPGWEVELFHNGVLLELYVVGEDGRYEFLKVPVLYGNNTFKLLFYGPQGQYREGIRRFNIGSSFPRYGQFNYKFSVDEKSESLFGVGRQITVNHPMERRVVGELGYGIAGSLVGAVGLVSTPLEDGEHRYFTASLMTGVAGILAGVETAFDDFNKGRATKLFALGSARRVSLRVEHKLLDKFHSEDEGDFSRWLDSESGVDLNTNLSLPIFGDLNFGVNGNVEVFESGDRRIHIKNRLSKGVLGVSFSNTMERTLYQGLASTLGQFSMRGYYRSSLVRLNVTYSLDPEAELNAFALSAQQKIYYDTLAVVRLTENLSVNKSRTLFGSLSWNRKNYKLALSVNMDDAGNAEVSANMMFSLGKNPSDNKWYMNGWPITNNGGVLANAYMDNNFNKQFDEGDVVIDESSFLVNKKVVSTSSGFSFSTGLTKNHYADVMIDSTTLDASLSEPVVNGYRVFPRPGVVASVSFPLVSVSEIDGVVYLVDDNDVRRSVSRIEVQLVAAHNGEVVKRFKSEYDGYYFIDKVLPGEYLLRINTKDLDYLKVRQLDNIKVIVSSDGDMFGGYDIRLAR